jgi:hypothetical protein
MSCFTLLDTSRIVKADVEVRSDEILVYLLIDCGIQTEWHLQTSKTLGELWNGSVGEAKTHSCHGLIMP